ncbi:MAG: glycosyltransferase family 39 protein [Bacteroidota bacterium]
MKKYVPILMVLTVLKLSIQVLGNRNYGFHRDELLHLSVSEHLAWGYFEFPPFIALLGKLSYWLFDYSLWGTRLFPTLAGVAILVLCGLMAKEMGGKPRAVFLAGVGILAFLPFYRNHTLFQPVAFDQLFWTIGFYFFIKFINTQHKKFLLLMGLSLGMGLMNKYTMLVWAFGLFICLFSYQRSRLFKNQWLYISGIMGLLLFLPNIIWQAQHDFPLVLHLETLKTNQLEGINPWTFLLDQVEMFPTFLLFTFGFIGLFFTEQLKPYRSIGVAALVIFLTLWLVKSKTYYVFALYPVLFAAAGVTLTHWMRKRPAWIYVLAASVFLPMAFFIPDLTPILPIEKFVRYADVQEHNGWVELTSDYADMFGWEEQVQLVDSVYQSLPPKEQNHCVLWAENYGEAGALKILGKRYNLPNPISRHGSFWTWGYGNQDADVWISLGNETPSVEYVFKEVELVKIITHKYAIKEENGIPLYICRKPKIDIAQWWAAYEDHVFD